MESKLDKIDLSFCFISLSTHLMQTVSHLVYLALLLPTNQNKVANLFFSQYLSTYILQFCLIFFFLCFFKLFILLLLSFYWFFFLVLWLSFFLFFFFFSPFLFFDCSLFLLWWGIRLFILLFSFFITAFSDWMISELRKSVAPTPELF